MGLALAVQPLPGKCIRIKRDGKPCKRWPCKGMTVCTSHGANPVGREKGRRRLEQAQAVERLGLGRGELGMSPAELLLRCNRVAAHDCEMLRELLASLEQEPDTTGFVKDEQGNLVPMKPELKALYGPTYHLTGVWTGEGKPHPYWSMHLEAEKHALAVSGTCLKLKLKDEETKANTLVAQAFVEAMRGVVQALGHNLQDPAVRDAMRQHLELVAGAPVIDA